MTIRSAVSGLVLVLAGWVAVMAAVMRFSDAAPAAVVVLPGSRLAAGLPEDAAILDRGRLSLTLANRPGLAGELYAAGAALVLPAGLTGCLPLSGAQREALAGRNGGGCGDLPPAPWLFASGSHIRRDSRTQGMAMLELNPNGAQPAANDLIKEGSEATFMKDVIEASREVPVIVDFWAPWCGPCRQLTPAIEGAVKDARGAVRLVKINVDENQGIAGQLRIQSIPTVYAFWQGQPVDGFQGAVPASELKAFIERLVKAAGGEAGGSLSEAVETAETMLGEGAAADAAQVFAAILEEDGTNAAAYGGLVRAYLALGETEQAAQLLDNAPDAIARAPELEAARAQLALARQAESAGPVAELRAAVEANPGDHQARFDLAQALHASGQVQEAVNELLEIFRRDREWNEGAAKAQLFTIFDALKPNDPVVLNGRRKLSSMIFA